MLVPKRAEVTGEREREFIMRSLIICTAHNEELDNLYCS